MEIKTKIRYPFTSPELAQNSDIFMSENVKFNNENFRAQLLGVCIVCSLQKTIWHQVVSFKM